MAVPVAAGRRALARFTPAGQVVALAVDGAPAADERHFAREEVEFPVFALASRPRARYSQRMYFRLLLCALIATLALSGCFDNDKKKPGTEKKKEDKKKEVTPDVSNDPTFQAFVGRLRSAVGQKDRREIAEALAPGFGYRWDQPPEGETPFDYWDKNNAWGELAAVLAQKFVPHEGYMVAPPQFASDPGYHGYRAGVRQFNGSWKLAYFVTGQDIIP